MVNECNVTSLGEWTMSPEGAPWRKVNLFVPGFNNSVNITVDAKRVYWDEHCLMPIDVGPEPTTPTLQAMRRAAVSDSEAYAINENTVETVLRSCEARLSTAGDRSPAQIAGELLNGLDRTAITVAALNAGDDIGPQAAAAHDELMRQFEALGVLRIKSAAPSVQPEPFAAAPEPDTAESASFDI
jgi:hypothetical protein